MGMKDQLNKLKDNWLIIALVVVALLLFAGADLMRSVGTSSNRYTLSEMDYAESSKSYAPGYYPQPSDDFAPEVKNRIIIKTASLSTEIERGTYDFAASTLNDVIKSSDSLILNENVNKYGETGKEYRQGSYQLKVSVDKYDSVVGQLKAIGEVKSFNENTQDITGEYVNLKTELATEKARLSRYNKMLNEATIVQDKITLSDKIFDQERRIAYLEDRMDDTEARVDYTTISLNINEKPSEYMNIAIVKFSRLWESLIDSFNALLYFVFAVLPWAAVIGIIVLIWRLMRKKS